MTITQNLLNNIRANTKAFIASQSTHIAVGDDDTPSMITDTTLGNETYRRAVDEVDTTGTGKTLVSIRIPTTDNNGEDISEVGSFDDPSAGEMKSRDTMITITKTSDIQVFLDLEFTNTVQEVT